MSTSTDSRNRGQRQFLALATGQDFRALEAAAHAYAAGAHLPAGTHGRVGGGYRPLTEYWLEGAELCGRIEMPVRLGIPQGLGGLSASVADPRFSTGVGLVLQAAKVESGAGMFSESHPSKPKVLRFDLKSWFSNLF